MGKQPYELSVWRDVPIAGTLETDGYFTDEKVAIIGSDSMDSPLKAYDVSLKELTNGDCTLTFSMLYDYEKDGERVSNPLFELLKNEIKLKLRRGEEYGFIDANGNIDFSILNGEIDFNEEEPNYEDTSVDYDNRWRDFVIKTIDKDSNTHVANIVAKEIFVNELGKNGWSVTLNTELENNYGTVEQLAEKVLDGSDWKVKKGYSPIERVKEPLFEYQIPEGTSIAAVAMRKGDNGSNKEITISANEYIYFFYNDAEFSESIESGKDGQWRIKAKESVQILYFGRKIDDEINPVAIDDGRVVIDDDYLFNYKIASAAVNVEVTGYSGYRIQDKTRTVYESTLDKYVEVYTNGSEEYFSYTETEYHVSPLVQNYLTNSTNFTSNAGWKNLNKEQEDPILTLYPEPEIRDGKVFWEDSKNSLVLKAGQTYVNSGPANAGFKVINGEKYIVRFSGDWLNDSLEASSGAISFSIKDRDNEEYFSSINEEIGFVSRENDIDYIYCQLDITKSSNSKQSLVLTVSVANANFYLYDIQLFAYQLDEETGKLIFPGDAPTSTIEDKRYFYKIENGKAVYYDGSNFTPLHEDGYHSVRFFETQESNYFNNIQSLAELFEVWVSFHIKHKKNGQIWLENGKPVKTVKFSQYSPNSAENHAGFKYGINLKGIKRTVDSNSIASKVIVKPNNQEYATDGMCTIARAPSNQTGETEIINFDYYINQGLISYGQVINDLYGTGATDLRYFAKLKNLNKQINEEATYVNAYSNTVSELEGQYDLYNAEILAYDNEISELTSYLNNLNVNDEKRTQYMNEIARLEILRSVALQNRDAIEKKENGTVTGTLSKYQSLINVAEERIKNLQKEKEDLKLKFYTKYSRFIQEGTWTDESYVDDELYYLDAVKISNTSAYPQVSYTINVLSIEDVDGYEAYKFNVGDRTYIEDVEFFGYVTKEFNGMSVKTPYRMEVIVSERNQNLDDASKTTITIKNYKNQFEELFQKITATTQSLQYQVGEYARAAGVVTPTGEIKVSTLEQSFQNNSLILSGSDNQSVIWDTGTGIEVIDNRSSNNRVRVVGGGVFISSDGGVTWSNAISGNGINTKYLIAGQIDASKINIVNGSVPYFRWDTNGITAFKVDGTIGNETYDTNKYVRFNQYGIYAVGAGGIGSSNGESIEGSKLDELIAEKTTLADKLKVIEENASFALTWKGLSLVASGGDYSRWQAVKLDAGQGLRLINEEYSFKATAEEIANKTDILNQMPYYFARFGKGEGTSYEYTGDNRFFPILAVGQFPDMPCTPYEKKDNLGNIITIEKEPVYGLRLRNRDGYVTLATDNRGELWVQDRIFVGPWGNLYDSSKISTTVGLNAKTISEEEFNNYLFEILSNLEPDAETITPDYLQKRSVRIWSGADNLNITDSPFLVLENGTLIAEKAYIQGNIQANSGNISGLLTIGDGRHGIDGSALENGYILWGGKEENSYKFSVDYTGQLSAQDAVISGSITAKDGIIEELLIPDMRAGITSKDEDVVIWIHKDNLIENKTSSNFYVTKDGDLYASKIFLRDSILIGEEDGYYKAGINASNQAYFWAGAENNDYANATFSVGIDGKVIAKSLNLVDGKLITNGAEINGRLLIREGQNDYIVIDSSQGISTSNYNSAYGWKIDMNGDAYFSNINARGEIISAVFSYNSVNTMGGDLYLAPTYYDYENTVKLYGGNNEEPFVFAIKVDKNTFDRDIWGIYSENDYSTIETFNEIIKTKSALEEITKYVRVKFNLLTINDNISTEYNNQEGRLYKVLGNEDNYYFYIYFDSSESLAVNRDKISNFSIALITGCGINLTAGATLGPAVIITDISKNGQIITQLGRLGGVNDEYFGELTGYGLYGQNAYLTGKVYLPNAGITDESIEFNGNNKISEGEGQYIRMWAGAAPTEKDKAPFVVTQDGSLYASKGIFSGIIQATDSTFSGWLETAGILIDDNQATYTLDETEIIYSNWYFIKSSTQTIESLIEKLNLDEEILKITVNGAEVSKENQTTTLTANSVVKINRETIQIIDESKINVFGQLDSLNLPYYTLAGFNDLNKTTYDGDTSINSNQLYKYYAQGEEKNYFLLNKLLELYNINIDTFNNLNNTNYTKDTKLYEQYIFNVGEDNLSPKSVFYVAYDRNNKEKFPEVTDKILQIDKNGISIWEGGLSVYSDYASGWRNSLEYKPSGEVDKYYGYQDEQNGGFPYIKAIDDEDYRLYSTGLNIGKFEKITEKNENGIEVEVNTYNPFIKISNGKISFIQYNNNTTGDFTTLEKESFKTESNWDIFDKEGILNIGNELVTFEKNSDEKVNLGVKGKLRVDNEIDTLNYLNFITQSDEIIVQIKKYEGTTGFDKGIDFVI